MKRKTFIVILTILILLGLALAAVNRDLFRYTYDTSLSRTFLPDIDGKKDTDISERISLKPGSYLLTMTMTVQGNRSGLYLKDSSDDIFFYAELEPGTDNPSFPFEIRDGTKQVRLGIHYEPEYSEIRIERMRITADHILYKDSLLRHMTVSILLIMAAVAAILRLCCPSVIWRIFPIFRDRDNEITFGILILLTLAACYPLLDGKTYIHGQDMFFHVTRIKGIAESLRAGYFPVRNQLYWLHNYGYGTGFFYPDVFLYFPAAMVLLGFNILTAYDFFLIICSFFSIFTTWYAAYRITRGDRSAAYAAAVMMSFAAYRLSNLYYRGTVGETQASVFFPLIILGLYEIFYGDIRRWPFFAFGFLGLLSCHIISLTMAAVLTAVFFITQIRKILTDRKIFAAIVKSVLLVTGIGAFFWIPMLEQSLTNPELRVNRLLTGTAGLNRANYAFPVRNYFVRFKVWSSVWQAQSIYPGWPMLLVPVFAVIAGKKRDRLVKAAGFMLIFALVLLWMCSQAFPWQFKIFLPFVTRIQFAYRLLLPATALLCLCGGICLSRICGKYDPRLWLSILSLFCFFSTAYPVLQESLHNRLVPKNMFVMQDNRVSGEEYLPRGLKQTFPGENADTVLLSGEGTGLKVLSHDRQKLSFRFTYELPEGSGDVNFSIPLIYYTGYRGTVTSDDGTAVVQKVTWDERGLVSIGNAGFPRGEVFVSYQKTLWQKISECISIVSILTVFWFLRRKRD